MPLFHQKVNPTQADGQGEWLWQEHRGTELCGKKKLRVV